MKKLFGIVIALLSFVNVFANHISGGELFYEYVGPGAQANTSRYQITMRLFRDCNSTGQTLQTESVVIGIYSNANSRLYTSVKLPILNPVKTIKLNTDRIPCLTNAPEVCFQVGIFTRSVDIPNNAEGYMLTWVRCCRPDLIGNLSVQSGVGATFATTIPGSALLQTGHNSSPQFALKDTALVCQNKDFVLDFGATDADSDSLSFSFCSAYAGGTSAFPNPGNDPGGPATTLNLENIPYQSPYSGNSPLGSQVTINAANGKITGKAPASGRYVINVCVTEWRGGKALNQHRKDFILEVGTCDYAGAAPLPSTSSWCKDYKVNFSNNNTSSAIQKYYWDFGVSNTATDTSTQASPNFAYPDTGTYTIKLVVTGAAGCIDSGTTTLGVYPKFEPDFEVVGSCYKTPFQFKDKTTSKYGVTNSWKWNFGDPATTADVSQLQNPSYQYPAPATSNVTLVVTNSKGCIDSITKPVAITDFPILNLPFADTLICNRDSLQLNALGNGTFSWLPAYNILNANTATPVVFPATTTSYIVQLTENGCSVKDTIVVRTVNAVEVYLGADTTICKTDNIVLQPISEGLQYQWFPETGLLTNATDKNAVARPDTSTMYFVTASVGSCKARDSINIAVVPYPQANAGSDVSICFGTRTQLAGVKTGSNFNWSPTTSLTNATTLSPLAGPTRSTDYILTVSDTLGCPKPVSDTVRVTIIPSLVAFAGHDTAIVAGQPLQLHATGGDIYAWTPATGMNNANIADPVVNLTGATDSIVYNLRVSTAEGCTATDAITIKIFKTAPDIFIPTAFTPNSDGRNDVLRPVLVGISNMAFFSIYNRWGQLLYTTSRVGTGWDGTFNGTQQASGTYIFMARATDYTGKQVVKKGTVVLIR